MSWVAERVSVLGLSDMCEEAPVFRERTSVGLDVHARSVVAAAIDGRTGEVFKARLTPSHAEVLAWIGKLPGPCAVVYESGPTGFGVARLLTAMGVSCEVVPTIADPQGGWGSGEDRPVDRTIERVFGGLRCASWAAG
jgi:hypothetical protein